MNLPNFVQIQMTELRRGPVTIDHANGGQQRPGAITRYTFYGALLPLSSDDLRSAPQGTYTANSRKLYTTHNMDIGTKVEITGLTYTITGVMDYGNIHPLKRYSLECKGVSAI